MSRCFEIDLDHSEGALLRVLGTVERRGFALIGMSADKPDADSYSVRLQVDGERDRLARARVGESDIRHQNAVREPSQGLLG